jgi:hypothetical protein
MTEGVPGGRAAAAASGPGWSQGATGLWSAVRRTGGADGATVEVPATLLLRVQGSPPAAMASASSGLPRDVVSLSDAARQRLAQAVQGRGQPGRDQADLGRGLASADDTRTVRVGPLDPPRGGGTAPRGPSTTEPGAAESPPVPRSRSGVPARIDVLA